MLQLYKTMSLNFKLRLYLAICGVLALSSVMLKSSTIVNSVPKDAARKDSPLVHQSAHSASKNSDDNAPEILRGDRIYGMESAFVIPQNTDSFSSHFQRWLALNGN
jgi:hypothetical protein